MKKLFFILISAVLFCSEASAENCRDSDFLPQIEIISSYGKLRYDTSKNIAQITDSAQKYGLAKNGLFASGLATVDIATDISANTIGRAGDDRTICVYPTKVTFFIGFSNPVVYISNTLKPETCEYKVVLRHEQTHQYINKEMLDYFLPLFREACTRIVHQTPAIPISSINQVDAASQQLTTQYNQKLLPLIDFFKQEMIAEQGRLDNKSNYLREKNLCL
ncbi:MAG: hypothetical protein KHX55_00480 [Proteobacteria bacterium]|nr:hypothetical protein [Pseudomonadota bacterium]